MNTWSDLLKAKELKNESLKKIRQRNPVLYIHNFELLKRYLPTTSVHNRFLDKQLALSLFYKLKEDSLQWNTYSMYLFEKKVESPHKTHSYYINDDSFPDGQYYFNGNKVSKPTPYFDFLKLASELVTGFVNEERIKREEHSLDLGSNHTWQANYAVTNIYETGKNSVGWHTDRLTYLGPRPIIASLSLGPTREFRLRKMGPDSNQTICSIPLRHNTLLIMWAPTQEEYKHCVPPQPTLTPYPDDNTARINITFRYFPEAFGPKNTPFCYCKVPCDLRVINKDPKQFGKYYFKCISEEGTGKKGCGYFKFVEFPDYPASYFNIDMLD
ncbi:hypothetical protein K502DRAFT_295504 [Neoconidiobolus thromboides FSU 785]|nr:hypothetical protein K502DRAFT_295504 [Neoconidiobolus thromboides FSU 785]